jgi:chlorophyll(ide) b reductase
MQNIVLTGGTNGLGKAMAREFVKRKHNVMIVGRDKQRLYDTKQQLGDHCFIHQCDIRDYKQVANLGLHSSMVFNGKIDHWINNAGINEGPIPFGELDLSDIYDTVSTNLLGSLYGLKVAYTIPASNVYIISGHGSNGQKTPDFAVYGSTKCALSQIALSLTEEFYHKGINVRIIAPGLMKTKLSEKLFNDDTLSPSKKFIFNLIAAEPDDVADKVVPKILSARGTGLTIRAC